MSEEEQEKEIFDLLERYGICYDEHDLYYNNLKILKAYERMLKNKKEPEYSLAEYELYFKSFYEDYKKKIYKDRPIINEIIGGYGELLFYNKLVETTETEVTWVSRYHGDKYGFDFVTYDEISREFTFYEVKTTINPDNLGKFYLTPNEYKKYQRISNICLDYGKVKFVIVNILIDDKGIIDEIDYCINNNITEFLEHDKSVVVTHNGQETSHGENILIKRLIKEEK